MARTGFLANLHHNNEHRSYTESGFTFADPRHFGGSAPTRSGVNVTEANAMKYSAFWCGVNLIAGHLSSFPLLLYKREGAGKVRYDDHRLYEIVHDNASPEMSSLMLRRTMQAHVLTWGNAYAEIERDQIDRVVALHLITPDRVTPFRASDTSLKYRVRNGINGQGEPTVLDCRDVLHIPGLGFDGMVGYSVIHMMRESVGLGLAMERFGSAFFGQGSSFGGVLSHPTTFAPGAKTNLEKSLKEHHQGLDNAHRFIVVEEGMQDTRLGIPPEDAQFLGSRVFQIDEMARWLNLPPHKLKNLEHATFSNIEMQGIEYYQDTMFPLVSLWESELNRKLIAPLERKSQFIEHLVDAVLRGDIKSRYDAYAVGRQWGWLSADDIRTRENMNPLADGKGATYLTPMNMADASKPAPAPAPQALMLPAPKGKRGRR